jgi:hypothetical protein
VNHPFRLALVAACLVTTAAFAQDASPSPSAAPASPAMPPMPTPVKEHEWLKQLEGEWTWVSEAPPAEGQPGFKCEGRESSKMLDKGFWLTSEGTGQYGEVTMHTRTVLGYDPHKKTYVGTVIVSGDSTLWVYTAGEVDATGKKLSMHCEGPNVMTMDPTTRVKYIETHELKDADTRVFTSSIEQPDGTLQPVMTATYTRVK